MADSLRQKVAHSLSIAKSQYWVETTTERYGRFMTALEPLARGDLSANPRDKDVPYLRRQRYHYQTLHDESTISVTVRVFK